MIVNKIYQSKRFTNLNRWMWEKELFNQKLKKKKKKKELINMIMETKIVMIIIRTTKIGNNSKIWDRETSKTNNSSTKNISKSKNNNTNSNN